MKKVNCALSSFAFVDFVKLFAYCANISHVLDSPKLRNKIRATHEKPYLGGECDQYLVDSEWTVKSRRGIAARPHRAIRKPELLLFFMKFT